jgi:tripartite-type tricarboxylate transporter receptor subunit TctC
VIRLAANCLLALGAALSVAGPVVYAQSYPAKTIRVLVAAAPGDSCDTLTRLIGPRVSERLGQQLVVDNRPGAGGQLGLATRCAIAGRRLHHRVRPGRQHGARTHLEREDGPPEYFGEMLRRDIDKWGKLARDIGFKPR